MKTKFYDHQGEHLIVYFAGWGTPLDAVAHLILPTNHNLLICYDYQDLKLDFDFSVYQQIRVVGMVNGCLGGRASITRNHLTISNSSEWNRFTL